jgi:hypothetical protein
MKPTTPGLNRTHAHAKNPITHTPPTPPPPPPAPGGGTGGWETSGETVHDKSGVTDRLNCLILETRVAPVDGVGRPAPSASHHLPSHHLPSHHLPSHHLPSHHLPSHPPERVGLERVGLGAGGLGGGWIHSGGRVRTGWRSLFHGLGSVG